jgi:predicted phage terminase large subunit-like protein
VDKSQQRVFDAAHDSLPAFCRFMFRRFQQPKHIAYIIDHLEALERGEIDRLMIECPPRHGKSYLCSWLFLAWFIGRHPELSVMHVSYGAALSNDFGSRIRNTLSDPRFVRIFPRAELRPDSRAMNRFTTTAGGNYYGLGYGGPVTGRGAQLMIIDDPIKSMTEAQSAAHRQTLRSYYESTLYTRLEPGARVVLISTRWHQDDLSGWLQRESEDKWKVLTLPAVAEPNDPLGRLEGHALWPERFNAAKLAKIRRQIGSIAWLAEYQQRPSAIEGGTFQRKWWGSYDQMPEKFTEIVFSLDTAFKTGRTNDYSVILVLGITRKAQYYILDMLRGRYEFPDLIRKTEALAERWPSVDRVLVEDKASGQSLIQALRHSTSNHFSVVPIRVDSDKLSRAISATAPVETGRVFLPQVARWLNDFLDELSSFPSAPHDDVVDSFSQAIQYCELEQGRFPGTAALNGLGEYLLDYDTILAAHGGNYNLAARACGLEVAEFQRRVERQRATGGGELLALYHDDLAEWQKLAGGGNAGAAASADHSHPGMPRFTIGWGRR